MRSLVLDCHAIMRINITIRRKDTNGVRVMTSPGMERDIEQRLADRAVRYTTGRRAVVAALMRADGPRSAAELHEMLASDVPLSSLYRSLTVLEDAGVVAPHFAAGGIARYELAEWLQGHHHHLICVECGGVEDLAMPGGVESQVEALVERIVTPHHFTPLNHALEIEGRCARCA